MAYLAGFGAEGDYLRGRFYTQWKSAQSFTDTEMENRVAWGNLDFTPPTDSQGLPQSWVRFRVLHSGGSQADITPNPIHRYDGTIVIEVFVPENQGEGTLDDLCDTAAGIFRGHTAQQGLRIRTPYLREVGADGAWYRKNVLIPFVRDTVHS